jgi:hypothetical protein
MFRRYEAAPRSEAQTGWRTTTLGRPLFILLAAWIFSGLPATTPAWVITDSGQGRFTLTSGTTGATELSGLTWAGGTQYYAVTDNTPSVYPLTIAVDPISGQITSAAVTPPISLAAGSDLEGIAYDATNASVFVSDETGPSIREHSLVDGSVLQTVSIPGVFGTHRTNLSLESLALDPGQAALWTANEEALSGDGPVSSFTAGTVVRLQKFDASLSPAGQWAYVTDPIHGDIGNNGRDIEVSGVSDLVVLPDGRLLVLERALGAQPFGFRNRLYEVDFTGASDVSAFPSLDGQTFTSVAKTLRWEGNFVFDNFEGAALGPPLARGAYSLVLVSDDGGGLHQGLYALRVGPPPCPDAPRPGCRTPARSSLLVERRSASQKRLVWNWRGSSLADASTFGDPTPPAGTGYSVCVYETANGVPSLALGTDVPPGSAWSRLGSSGFRRRDRNGSAGGITSLLLKTAPAAARVVVRGKGSNLALSPSTPGQPLLSADPTVTIQVSRDDVPAECFAANYSTPTQQSETRFKAKN